MTNEIMKHTAGEFVARIRKVGRTMVDRSVVVVVDDDLRNIATVRGPTPDEADGNTYLFAAAPKMLTCCKRALDALDRHCGDDGWEDMDTEDYQALEAVITQAQQSTE